MGLVRRFDGSSNSFNYCCPNSDTKYARVYNFQITYSYVSYYSIFSTILKNKKLPVSFRCFVPNIYWYILTVHFSLFHVSMLVVILQYILQLIFWYICVPYRMMMMRIYYYLQYSYRYYSVLYRYSYTTS